MEDLKEQSHEEVDRTKRLIDNNKAIINEERTFYFTRTILSDVPEESTSIPFAETQASEEAQVTNAKSDTKDKQTMVYKNRWPLLIAGTIFGAIGVLLLWMFSPKIFTKSASPVFLTTDEANQKTDVPFNGPLASEAVTVQTVTLNTNNLNTSTAAANETTGVTGNPVPPQSDNTSAGKTNGISETTGGAQMKDTQLTVDDKEKLEKVIDIYSRVLNEGGDQNGK